MKKRELIEEVYSQLSEVRRDIKDVKIQLSELLNIHNNIMSKDKCRATSQTQCDGDFTEKKSIFDNK